MDLNFDKEKALEALKGLFKDAEKLLGDKTKIDNLVKEFEAKINEKHSLGEIVDNVKVMIALVKDYVTGTYKDVSTKTIVAVVAAALYMVSPKDIIPDNLPFIGIVDDLAVIALCWELIDEDVKKYQASKVSA